MTFNLALKEKILLLVLILNVKFILESTTVRCLLYSEIPRHNCVIYTTSVFDKFHFVFFEIL